MTRWPRWVKITLGVVGAFFVLAIIAAIVAPPKKPSPSPRAGPGKSSAPTSPGVARSPFVAKGASAPGFVQLSPTKRAVRDAVKHYLVAQANGDAVATCRLFTPKAQSQEAKGTTGTCLGNLGVTYKFDGGALKQEYLAARFAVPEVSGNTASVRVSGLGSDNKPVAITIPLKQIAGRWLIDDNLFLPTLGGPNPLKQALAVSETDACAGDPGCLTEIFIKSDVNRKLKGSGTSARITSVSCQQDTDPNHLKCYAYFRGAPDGVYNAVIDPQRGSVIYEISSGGP